MNPVVHQTPVAILFPGITTGDAGIEGRSTSCYYLHQTTPARIGGQASRPALMTALDLPKTAFVDLIDAVTNGDKEAARTKVITLRLTVIEEALCGGRTATNSDRALTGCFPRHPPITPLTGQAAL